MFNLFFIVLQSPNATSFFHESHLTSSGHPMLAFHSLLRVLTSPASLTPSRLTGLYRGLSPVMSNVLSLFIIPSPPILFCVQTTCHPVILLYPAESRKIHMLLDLFRLLFLYLTLLNYSIPKCIIFSIVCLISCLGFLTSCSHSKIYLTHY